MSTQSFFNIIDQVARKDLIDFVNHNKTEFTLKILNQYVKTKVLYKKNDTHLSLNKFGFYEFSNELTICSFQVNGEKYLFRSHLSSTTSDYVLEIPQDIYQLQRRNHYRVAMPASQSHTCEITTPVHPKAKTKVVMRNISLGGCSFTIDHMAEINQNDSINLSMIVDKFSFEKIPLTVKRARYLVEIDTTMVACSFDKPDAELLTELQSLLMFLDRVQRGKNAD